MRYIVLLFGIFAVDAFACERGDYDTDRIAVAGGSITEILYFLGEQDRIVAVDTTSNYPAEALELPSVGYVRALSAEGLISLNPTLIIGEDDMGPPVVLDQIAATGIDHIRLEEIHTADGILAKIRCIAAIIGVSDKAERRIEEQLGDTLRALAAIDHDANKPRAGVILGLRDGVPLGAGLDTSGAGLLAMAGAENVFVDFDGWKPVSLEGMIKSNPRFVVVPQRGVDSAGGKDELLSHPALKLTEAAQTGALVSLDGMAMLGFGPRTLEIAVELADTLNADSN
ncbi:MAG: ABC transporter substrate-binding protein [Pseudomonadota bacterium]